MQANLEFNLFKESKKIKLYSSYAIKFNDLGIDFSDFYFKLDKFIEDNSSLDLDCNYLKPKDFVNLCDFMNIGYDVAYDDYYEFVLLKDYSTILLNARYSLNLSQKELAKIVNLSPVSICAFENKILYPTRKQYDQLKSFLFI